MKPVFAPGDTFHGYVVERQLGAGGLGTVWLARHAVLDAPFAIKVLDRGLAREKGEDLRRFVREAKLATQIKHPNLVAVHDVGYDSARDIHYIVMDYVSGTAAARRNGEWSSEIARDGLWHKLGEIFAVLVAALCDIALGIILKSAPFDLPFEFTTLVTPIVLLWYIITELGSILENAGKMGAPLPKWLKKMLKQYKDTIDASQGEPPEADEK